MRAWQCHSYRYRYKYREPLNLKYVCARTKQENAMETEGMSSLGIMFFMACNPSSWKLLVSRNVISRVAGRLSMETSFFRKYVVSFKFLAVPRVYGNRIESK